MIDSFFVDVCYQPLCNFFQFPADCALPGADVICGRFCGNQLCGSAPPRRRRNQQRQRNRIRSHNRIRNQKHHRKG